MTGYEEFERDARALVARPLNRYSTQQITAEDEWALMQALRSPWLTQGPCVEHFEEALAEYVGAKYAIAVSSGTAALHLAYLASGAVLFKTSPLSFVATANAALLFPGGEVEFIDVDPATGNVTTWPDDPRAPVCVVVHYAGRAAPIPHDLVIEDACHALGAMDFDGCSRVGSCAHSLATVFSFHPVKPITTGEGGAVTTNSPKLADRMRLLRSHGRERESGLMWELGLNYRMTELQAALGRSQLKRCDQMRTRRWQLANEYAEALACILVNKADDKMWSPTWDPSWFAMQDQEQTSHHLFPVRVKVGLRGCVMEELLRRGIGVQVHYSPIIPLQPYYVQRYGYKSGSFPQAEAWAAEELSLPLHAGMTAKDVETVCAALAKALE